jgi:small-conductance mechanosensitive channel
MTEEFDALQTFDIWGVIQWAVVLLVLGISIEIGLRLLRRRARSKNRSLLNVILGALLWHPLFWCIVIGFGLPLVNAANNPIVRQQRLNFILSLLLISITIIVVRITIGWLKLLAAKKLPASVSIVDYLLTGIGVIVVILIALVLLDAPTSVVVLTLVASSVGFGLAFNEPLSNLFGGVQLTASRRLNQGDYVRLPSGNKGYVTDIEWDVTTVRQIENNLIIVPNSVMVKAEIINYQLPESEMYVLADVGVSYDSDLERVERVTVEVAEDVMHDVSGGVPTSSPFIRYNNFADFSINFTIYMRGQAYVDQLLIRHEFIKRLHKRFDEEGIVIPYPIRTLHTPATKPLSVINRVP